MECNLEEKTVFQYTYSTKEQEEVQRIRSKYIPKEESKMDRLRRLDAGVTHKATMKAVTVGVLGALIMGSGMSLAMTEIGTVIGLDDMSMTTGIVVGLVGMALAAFAFPVYNRVLQRERKKAALEVLSLTEELMR